MDVNERSESNDRWFLERKSRFIDSERRSLDAFLDEIEIAHCFPENVDLAKKIVFELSKRFNLVF